MSPLHAADVLGRVQAGGRRGARPARPRDRAERAARFDDVASGRRRVPGTSPHKARRRTPGQLYRRPAASTCRARARRSRTTSSSSRRRTTSPATRGSCVDARKLDYLLGRNALSQSYVTGWGEVASHQQHSRVRAPSTVAAAGPAARLARGAVPTPRRRRGTRRPRRPSRTAAHRRRATSTRSRLVDQRDHGQLELGAVVGRVVGRRPGRQEADHLVSSDDHGAARRHDRQGRRRRPRYRGRERRPAPAVQWQVRGRAAGRTSRVRPA